MEKLLSLISTEVLFIITVANFLLILTLFIMNFTNRSKIKKLKSRYSKFMNGLSDRNLEELVDYNIAKVNEVIGKSKEMENHINYLERNVTQCVQKVGVVRYNAFENVGSDLSFSTALLDANDDGFVVSGIYARDSSSTYVKPVTGGKSRYVLSAEEIQAIDQAKKSLRERLYAEKIGR